MSTAQRDARIITAQAELLDYTGHVRTELTPYRVRRLVHEINVLRIANGWKTLNMNGRKGIA
jgi:hypothetical protein